METTFDVCYSRKTAALLAPWLLKQIEPTEKSFVAPRMRELSGTFIKTLLETHHQVVRVIWYLRPEEHAGEGEFDSLIDQIRSLVDKCDLPAARELIGQVDAGKSRVLDQWRSVIAMPVARVTGQSTDRDLRSDSEWLEKNSWQYVDEWVALKDGQLLDHDLNRAELRARLREQGKLAGAFVVKVSEGE